MHGGAPPVRGLWERNAVPGADVAQQRLARVVEPRVRLTGARCVFEEAVRRADHPPGGRRRVGYVRLRERNRFLVFAFDERFAGGLERILDGAGEREERKYREKPFHFRFSNMRKY